MSYVSGFVIPVKAEDKAAYIASAQASWALFKEYGATEQVETWGADVPDGKLTSFPIAVKLEPGEVVVFAWVKWPDKATADEGFRKMMEDPRMEAMNPPFDGKRMIWGGFETIFET